MENVCPPKTELILLNTSCVPGTILSTSNVLIYLILITLWGRYYYHFKDEETEAPRFSNLPDDIHLRSGKARMPTQARPPRQTHPSDSGQSLASEKAPDDSNPPFSLLVQLWQEHRGQWHHQPSFAQESVWSCSQIHQGSLLGQSGQGQGYRDDRGRGVHESHILQKEPKSLPSDTST